MNHYVPILQEHVSGAKLDLDELLDRAGMLVLTLTDSNGQCTQLKFDSYMAYRKVDEGDALLTLSAMRRSGGCSKCLYRVDDSDFLAWFNAERCGQVPGQPLVHYSIATVNDIVDVLSFDPPAIEVKEVTVEEG